jgi:hypothetical protein
MDTFNIVISSKNKYDGDTNSFLTVKLKDDIYIANDDEVYICMQSFNMVKSFYACQSDLNNHFQVIFRLPNEPTVIELFDRYLSQGNYNINSLMQEIKTLTNNALFSISYDSKLNKFLFKNVFQPAFDVYIKPITAGVFFGLENGVEYKILPEGTYSSTFINVSGYENMIIKMGGDVNFENTVSNLQDKEFAFDKILGVLNINDIAPMDSIIYLDAGSCMYKHKVNNSKISSFTIQIVNENGDKFPQMSDWIMTLKVEKIKKGNDFAMTERILQDINYYLSSIYLYLNIPSKITYDDIMNTL